MAVTMFTVSEADFIVFVFVNDNANIGIVFKTSIDSTT